MNTLALLIAHDVRGMIITALILGVAIWLIFYVIPLPPVVRTILGVVVAVLLILWLIPGCATDTGDPKVDRRGRITNAVLEETFNSVLAFGLHEGAAYVSGQNGQDAAAAAFQAAQSGILSSHGIEHIVKAAAGPTVANEAASAFAAAAPASPAEATLVSNTIGAALQIAANQLAK